MSEFIDYYEILQVHPNADPEVIQKAYKALMLKHHPDKGGDEEAAKRITGAYYVLSDANRRRAYDLTYREHSANPAAMPATQVVEIPPEVIDRIMAATLAEMTAATVRTAGRMVVAAGAASIAPIAETLANARDARYAESLKQNADDRARAIRQVEGERAFAEHHLTPATKEWLVVWLFNSFRGTKPPSPPERLTLDETTALIRQRVSPTAGGAVYQATEYPLVGHCKRCDRTVHVGWEVHSTWEPYTRCVICDGPVFSPQAVLKSSPEEAAAVAASEEASAASAPSTLRKATYVALVALPLVLCVWSQYVRR